MNTFGHLGRLRHPSRAWLWYAGLVIAAAMVVAAEGATGSPNPVHTSLTPSTSISTDSSQQGVSTMATNDNQASSNTDSNTSANTSTNPPSASVTINGQTTTVQGTGSVDKTVTTPNGKANISISVNGTSSGSTTNSSSVYVNTFSSDSSSTSSHSTVHISQSGP